MITARDALERLREGNARFVSHIQRGEDLVSQAHGVKLVGDQAPFAVILGCSDSRVPAELVFDQGLGDLFVIRVAGNVVAPSQIGSVEFAAEQFGTRLIVVLGHTRCGAVQATVDALENPDNEHSANIGSIVDRIRPAIRTLFESPIAEDRDRLIALAVRANVRASVNVLRCSSKILERLMETDGLQIVGAEYALESGKVEFLEDAAR
ncbi:MAG: carbonic anhydrase [Xanthomonadales bacterium]|nr:carbonic anhydrase [Xanthomonadales bacterium]